MAKLINAKCPNCGAILELPNNLDRAFCTHCGGKVIIARDETHYHTYQAQKTAIACPECGGKGYFICTKCKGQGGCTYYSYSLYQGRYVNKYCQAGWCPKCNGKGTSDALIFKNTCKMCQGNKICPECRGTHKCIKCNGTGRITCTSCNGSGFKVYRGG